MNYDINIMKSSVAGTLAGILLLLFLFSSCTISMQNISTHGSASDLVDEEQTASPQVSTTIPLIK